MALQFTPFTLEALNKGKLLQQINQDIEKMTAEMLAYVRTYGEHADKSKAVLSLKLSVICVNANATPPQFALKVEATTALPKRPIDVALALADTDDDGKPVSILVNTFPVHAKPEPTLPFAKAPLAGAEDVDPETGEDLAAAREAQRQAGSS